MASKKTIEDFLKEASEIHGDIYDYSRVVYINSKTPVEIICRKHGSFFQTPNKHVSQKHGCPLCAKNSKLDTASFIKKAVLVHGDLYDYSLADYKGADKKIQIICRGCGTVFSQLAGNHLKGKGCPACRYKKSRKTLRQHYGVENPMLSEVLVKKQSASVLEHYGVENPAQSDLVQQRMQGTCLQKYGKPFYSQTEEYNDKVRQTSNCLYGMDFYSSTEECREKVRSTNLSRYGVDNYSRSSQYAEKKDIIMRKQYKTKLRNHSFNSSASEDMLYDMLIEHFGTDDVIRQYISEAYPFRADFYIKSLDLYIEFNGTWTHGKHWYDSWSEADRQLLKLWQSKNKEYYDNAVEVWSKRDVYKRGIAKAGHLNYIVFWQDDLLDARLWFEMGCPLGNDAVKMYSWFPSRKLHNDIVPHAIKGSQSVIALTKYYQFNVFYHRELELWKKDPMHAGLDLHSFLFLNRYKYLGKCPDQLTDLMLLRGMNISGVLRGYTVFDNTLMRQVLAKYDIGSIYDPCAGWGERLFTAYQAGIPYTGIDINAALVDGYERIISDFFMKDQHFMTGDAASFEMPNNCISVITCPPYGNTEIYSRNGAENLSETAFIDWWKAVVSHCSRAKYFCFQINQKWKERLSQVLTDSGYTLAEEMTFKNIRASHFNRSNGQVHKKEYESMLIFEKFV